MPTDIDNPFVILSYIAGPALLTNATSLLTLATTNRFARSVDRARHLLGELAHAGPELEPILRRDLEASQRRARVIARAMAGLYLAAGMFALATMLSVVGGVLAQLGVTTGLGVDIVAAAVAGAIGFVAFVTAALALIEESRLALRALTLEAREVDVRLAATRS